MSDIKDNKKTIVLPENVLVDYTFERMLKSFLKDIQKSGIMQEIKERRYYTKPSEIRHKIEGTLKRKAKLTRRRKRRK